MAQIHHIYKRKFFIILRVHKKVLMILSLIIQNYDIKLCNILRNDLHHLIISFLINSFKFNIFSNSFRISKTLLHETVNEKQ